MKLVLDTHVWLDWLVFDDAGVRKLRNAVHLGRAEIVMDAACDAELERVLAYDLGKHRISPAAQLAALAQARRLSRRVDAALSVSERARLPRCKDLDDQKFLELAMAAKADALVTKDRALLEMHRRISFRIATPAQLFGE